MNVPSDSARNAAQAGGRLQRLFDLASAISAPGERTPNYVDSLLDRFWTTKQDFEAACQRINAQPPSARDEAENAPALSAFLQCFEEQRWSDKVSILASNLHGHIAHLLEPDLSFTSASGYQSAQVAACVSGTIETVCAQLASGLLVCSALKLSPNIIPTAQRLSAQYADVDLMTALVTVVEEAPRLASLCSASFTSPPDAANRIPGRRTAPAHKAATYLFDTCCSLTLAAVNWIQYTAHLAGEGPPGGGRLPAAVSCSGILASLHNSRLWATASRAVVCLPALPPPPSSGPDSLDSMRRSLCHTGARASFGLTRAFIGFQRLITASELVMALSGAGREPGHPIKQILADPDWQRFQIASLERLMAHGGGGYGDSTSGGSGGSGGGGDGPGWALPLEEARLKHAYGDDGEPATAGKAERLESMHGLTVEATLNIWQEVAAMPVCPRAALPPPLQLSKLMAGAARALTRLFRGQGLGGTYGGVSVLSRHHIWASAHMVSRLVTHSSASITKPLPGSAVAECVPHWLEAAAWALAELTDGLAAAAAAGADHRAQEVWSDEANEARRRQGQEQARRQLGGQRPDHLANMDECGTVVRLLTAMRTVAEAPGRGVDALSAAARSECAARLARAGLPRSLDHALRLHAAGDAAEAAAAAGGGGRQQRVDGSGGGPAIRRDPMDGAGEVPLSASLLIKVGLVSMLSPAVPGKGAEDRPAGPPASDGSCTAAKDGRAKPPAPPPKARPLTQKELRKQRQAAAQQRTATAASQQQPEVASALDPDLGQPADDMGLVITVAKRVRLVVRRLEQLPPPEPEPEPLGASTEQLGGLLAALMSDMQAANPKQRFKSFQTFMEATHATGLLLLVLSQLLPGMQPRLAAAREAGGDPRVGCLSAEHEALSLALLASCEGAAAVAHRVASEVCANGGRMPFMLGPNAGSLAAERLKAALISLVRCLHDHGTPLPWNFIMAAQPHRLLTAACGLLLTLELEPELEPAALLGMQLDILLALTAQPQLCCLVQQWLAPSVYAATDQAQPVAPAAPGGARAPSEGEQAQRSGPTDRRLAGCLAGPLAAAAARLRHAAPHASACARALLRLAAGEGGQAHGAAEAAGSGGGSNGGQRSVVEVGLGGGGTHGLDAFRAAAAGVATWWAVACMVPPPSAVPRMAADCAAVAAHLPPAVPPSPPLAYRRLRFCAHPGCDNFGGVCEDALPLKQCKGCRALRYCSPECQRAHWGEAHRRECRELRRPETA